MRAIDVRVIAVRRVLVWVISPRNIEIKIPMWCIFMFTELPRDISVSLVAVRGVQVRVIGMFSIRVSCISMRIVQMKLILMSLIFMRGVAVGCVLVRPVFMVLVCMWLVIVRAIDVRVV
ncbi:MAG TPA: hypothetical protein PLN81_12560 [Bacillota bacterium]|nr:hypothetical protein [Bacillota bacterium]